MSNVHVPPFSDVSKLNETLNNLYNLEVAEHLHKSGLLTNDQFLEVISGVRNKVCAAAIALAKENADKQKDAFEELAKSYFL